MVFAHSEPLLFVFIQQRTECGFFRSLEFSPQVLVSGLGYTSTIERILGQSKPIETLLRAAQDNRQHHAWIFSGPRGVGKYTTAMAFARLLLNIESGDCSSHRDLHVIRKEDVAWSQNPALQRRKQTNIPLDLLRERIIGGKTSDGKQHDSVAFKTPVAGNQKVFIIDEAELLAEDGQNALLKTVEEPPPGTTIILVTSREDLLLPTIRSRCQSLPFSPLDQFSLNQWSSEEEFGVNSAALSWALSFSSGSPGLVCEAIETGLPELANELFGFLSLQNSTEYIDAYEKMYGFVETNIARWMKDNPNTSKEAANRRAMNLLLLMLSHSVRGCIRNNDVEVGVELAGVLVDVEKQLRTNISIKILLESLAARWVNRCVGDAVFMSRF